ncbi:MAG: discoidin domain-containing protein [Sedimentisphaerales bacterium]|nr:discoidin domain-containing protein [Sedimentisphaerales bacterium]
MFKKMTSLFSFLLVLSLTCSMVNAQPLNQDTGPDGIVSVEAEHCDYVVPGQNGTGWEEVQTKDGFTGEAGMEVLNESTNDTGYAAESSSLNFEINFVKTGTHYVWLLAWGVDGSSDSCHAGLDGEEIDTCDRMSGWNGVYQWSNNTMDGAPSTFEVRSTGVHTLNIWMREDNLVVDKVVLTTNPDFTLSDTEPGPAESSRGARIIAFNPNPSDGVRDFPRDVVLSWESGALADTHDVYFGNTFDDVNDASRANPLGVLESQGQTENSYLIPERLDFANTYYWRIDEVEADGATIHKGGVWSFTTELFSYAIENVIATASSFEESKGPENTVNGSGLDGSGLLHGNIGVETMWLSNQLGEQPTWIQFEFDKVYKLHEMWIWNSNESLESVIGLGVKEAVIEYSENGTDYTTLGTTHEITQAPGTVNYAHNTTIDMAGVSAKYVRITANSNWKGILNQYGLSEVRFFSIPVRARAANPASGATNTEPDLTLSFWSGREAEKHDVYFSEDLQAVEDGSAAVTTVTETSYGPVSLDLGKTYYWRVDEVNDAETPSIWTGDIWSFSTLEFLVIDDFESYNDLDPSDPNSNRIFNSWIDGFDNPTVNGSIVGYNDPPFAEQTVVHGGFQSMPLFYNNSVGNSEATLTLSSNRDWSARGIGELSLWFRGNPAGFTEQDGVITMNASGADIWNTVDEFRYAYRQLSGAGSITARVLSVENTDPWAKAGVMIRQSLDAGSKFAAVYITPGNGCRYQARLTPSSSATSDTSVATPEQTAVTAPYWIRIERDTAGNFNGYYSSNGSNWVAMSWNPQNISMPENVYIGLAVTSHNPGVSCEAQFSDITTTGSVSPSTWSHEAFGVEMASNDDEQMYVAIANSNGAFAVVYHDNTSATQTGDWTEWIIDLQEFSNQGVNPSNVDKLSIGIGNKNNPQAGGSGLIYFDDIRLYPHREPTVQAP